MPLNSENLIVRFSQCSVTVGTETIFSTDMYFSQSFNQTSKFNSPFSVAEHKIHFIVTTTTTTTKRLYKILVNTNEGRCHPE